AENCRERRINESGIEQTGVAFDVILECRHDADPFPSANVPVRLQPRLQPESGAFFFCVSAVRSTIQDVAEWDLIRRLFRLCNSPFFPQKRTNGGGRTTTADSL